MMYVDFEAGSSAYKLRLDVRSTIALEKRLGCNPLMIFKDDSEIPSLSTMIDILHASLQPMHHGISLDKACGIFEEWLEAGHTVTDFVAVIIDVYKASGIIAGGETEKN